MAANRLAEKKAWYGSRPQTGPAGPAKVLQGPGEEDLLAYPTRSIKDIGSFIPNHD